MTQPMRQQPPLPNPPQTHCAAPDLSLCPEQGSAAGRLCSQTKLYSPAHFPLVRGHRPVVMVPGAGGPCPAIILLLREHSDDGTVSFPPVHHADEFRKGTDE